MFVFLLINRGNSVQISQTVWGWERNLVAPGVNISMGEAVLGYFHSEKEHLLRLGWLLEKHHFKKIPRNPHCTNLKKEREPAGSLWTYWELETAQVSFFFFLLIFQNGMDGVDTWHVVLRPLFQLWAFCACSLMSSAELQMPHTSYSCALLTLIAAKAIDGLSLSTFCTTQS